jgi:guanylate kinase
MAADSMKKNNQVIKKVGRKGKLIIISAPSGAGKSTVIQKLLKRSKNIVFSVSYTTRNIRPGERDGEDYHFIKREAFDKMVKQGKFLEWAVVYKNYYGTSKVDTKELVDRGIDVLLDIDVQGARQVSRGPFKCVKIFILPPSKDALIQRLIKRGGLDKEQMHIRLKGALRELKGATEYDYIVLNDNVKMTVKTLEAIILSEKCKIGYNKTLLRQVIDSFGNGE